MISLKKGMNLGGWMSQCDYSEDRLNNFIKEEDVKKIASWGMDHVRLPIDYNVIQNEDGSIIKDGFERIDKAVGWAEKYDLSIVLDLHKTMGYSFDKGENEAGFFDDEKLQEYFYLLWEEFAKRYGDRPDTICFELLNELTDKDFIDEWNRISLECIKSIRKYAADTYILVGSYENNAVFAVKDLAPAVDNRIIYNFHCYEPLRFTHQGAYWIDDEYPTLRIPFKDSGVTGEFFEDMFRSAIEKAEKDGVGLYCGEYGVIDVVSPEDTLSWYRVIHAVFEKYQIGHAAWSYKEMDFGISDARLDSVRDELLTYL